MGRSNHNIPNAAQKSPDEAPTTRPGPYNPACLLMYICMEVVVPQFASLSLSTKASAMANLRNGQTWIPPTLLLHSILPTANRGMPHAHRFDGQMSESKERISEVGSPVRNHRTPCSRFPYRNHGLRGSPSRSVPVANFLPTAR